MMPIIIYITEVGTECKLFENFKPDFSFSKKLAVPEKSNQYQTGCFLPLAPCP